MSASEDEHGSDEVGGEHPFPVTIAAIPGKGQGAVASRNVIPGEVVLRVSSVAAVPNEAVLRDACCGCMRYMGPDYRDRHECPQCHAAAFCLSCQTDVSNGRARILHMSDCNDLQFLYSSPLFSDKDAAEGSRSKEGWRMLRCLLRLLAFQELENEGLPPVEMKAEGDVLGDSSEALDCACDHLDELPPETIQKFADTAMQAVMVLQQGEVDPEEVDQEQLDEYIRLLAILNFNSFELTDMRCNKEVGIGLFASAAIFNHSCAANCKYYLDDEGFLAIEALEAISEGEELTISYLNPALPREARQAKLKKDYLFDCVCPLCESQK